MTEMTPQQRYVHVLELMEANHNANPGVDWRPFSEEAAAFDYVTYIKAQGAMRAGEIPSPAGDPQTWVAYLEQQRAEVAQ